MAIEVYHKIGARFSNFNVMHRMSILNNYYAHFLKQKPRLQKIQDLIAKYPFQSQQRQINLKLKRANTTNLQRMQCTFP